MQLREKTIHRLAIVVAFVAATFTANLLTYYGPIFEGRLMPVAASLETDVVDLGQNTFKISGKMSKWRDCELISSVAYITDALGNRVQTKVRTANTVRLREIVTLADWGPWEFDIPALYTSASIEVITHHQCHPLWTTRSVFAQAKLR